MIGIIVVVVRRGGGGGGGGMTERMREALVTEAHAHRLPPFIVYLRPYHVQEAADPADVRVVRGRERSRYDDAVVPIPLIVALGIVHLLGVVDRDLYSSQW